MFSPLRRDLPRGLVVAVRLFLALNAVSALAAEAVPVPLASTNIQNLFQVTPQLFSGSQPEGDLAFAELARLGVRTIVSVDGTKPDVEAARRHGLQYIHLPFGYGGIPTNRVPELARAAQLPGPIFVHCHHGLHRGPAAVAVMCLAADHWSPSAAEAWLKLAGTSTNYPGLYRAAREFHMPDAQSVAAVTNLPSVAPTSSVVDAMVDIDGHFDRLKEFQKVAWKSLPNHPDVTATEEATLLWEQFRELARHADAASRPADYHDKLAGAEKATDTFRKLLEGLEGSPEPQVEAAFQNLGKACSSCHKLYRN